MELDLTKFEELKNSMGIHAQADYPREACGIITKDLSYIPCKNISPQPKESFILDPIALLEYDENILGIFHSHPGSENPLPSEEDVASTVFDEYKFVVGFAGKFFTYWFDKQLKILRYEILEEHHLVNG